jgi:hypothetical protein
LIQPSYDAMPQGIAIGFWLGLAVVAANLPWLSERWLLVIARRNGLPKPFWLRLVEWALLCGLVLGLGLGFEYKATGTVHAQDWEFYTVTPVPVCGRRPARIYLPLSTAAPAGAVWSVSALYRNQDYRGGGDFILDRLFLCHDLRHVAFYPSHSVVSSRSTAIG